MNCPQIEIETKFVQPKDLQKRLQQGGAKFLKEVHYSDTFFDNSSCSLTLQDNWLRRRDEAWELKIPAGGKSRGKEKGIDGYNEVTDECEIIQHLSRCLGLDNEHEQVISVQELTKKACLLEFASYQVARRSYAMPGGTVHVDLDTVSYGYEIGELEIIVQKDIEIPKAEQKLRDTAAELGIEWGSGIHGKMDEYLRRFRKEHYQMLIEHGVIHPTDDNTAISKDATHHQQENDANITEETSKY